MCRDSFDARDSTTLHAGPGHLQLGIIGDLNLLLATRGGVGNVELHDKGGGGTASAPAHTISFGISGKKKRCDGDPSKKP